MPKGSLPMDMIVIMIVMVFIISFFVILADKINSDIMDSTSSALNVTIMNQTTKALHVFDTGIPFIFFGFILAMILLAWYLRSTPILAFVLIMVMAVVLIVGASISNTWYDVARSDSLISSSNDYPYTVYINENIPLFLGVMRFIVIIFLFAKPKEMSM